MPTATEEMGRSLEAKRQELADFIKIRTTQDGRYDFQGDDLKAFNDRGAEISRLQDEFEQARAVEITQVENERALKSLRQVKRLPLFDGNFGSNGRRIEAKSLGDLFVESAQFKAHTGGVRPTEWAVDLDLSLKAITTEDALPYAAQQPGIVGYPSRRPVVADLVPQTETEQPSIIYLEQTTEDFQAAPVAETNVKPESDFGWARRTVSFEVIAHYTKITNQTLEDIPAIRDVLNNEMVLGLQLAEEYQLLNGNGTPPAIQGFLTKSGVQTQAKGSDNTFAAFLKALTKIRYTGRANPTGAIFHPNDWQDILLTQDSQGRFVFGDPALAQQNNALWGIRSVVTDAMTENTAFIGDFQMYSRLWRKGGIRTILGLEGDDLKRNQQTLLVEERVALQISRAAAFCKLTGI